MGAQQALAAAGITLNSQAAASFNTVTTALGQAAAAAEKAKIDTTINFTAGTIGLNDNELQIAQQLKTLYGNDIPAALNSAEAAQMRLNQSLADAKTYAVDFSQALMQGLQQGLSGMAALGYAAVQTANQIANQFAKLGTQNIFGGITSGNANQLLSGIGSLGVGIGLSFLTGQAQQVQQAQQQWQQAQQTWQNEQAGFAEFTASLTGDDAAAEAPGASLATWRPDHRQPKRAAPENRASNQQQQKIIMSALTFLVRPKGLHVFADTAVYHAVTGEIVRFESKIVLPPEFPAVIATAGPVAGAGNSGPGIVRRARLRRTD